MYIEYAEMVILSLHALYYVHIFFVNSMYQSIFQIHTRKVFFSRIIYTIYILPLRMVYARNMHSL